MIQPNRIYGLMAGITIGFAMWGAMGTAGWQTTGNATAVEAVVSDEADKPQEGIPNALKNLHSQSAVLIDGDSGRVLFGKNETQFRPMASTTKIMTCILALEQADPDTICTVSAAAASQPKVHLGAAKGKQFYLKDLLYSLMLESHNDSAVMIAEAVAGSVDDFAVLMNQKARQLGCMDTCFLTPNGLDARRTLPDGTELSHGTTAVDLARIMRYCILESPKKDDFLQVTRTSDYAFTDVSGKSSYSCRNHNTLLVLLQGAMSGKTGFTGGAGYSYVGAYENDGRVFVLALLGCGWPPHRAYKWSDAQALFSYGAQEYHYRDVYEELKPRPILVEDGVEDRVFPQLRLTEEEKHVDLLLSGQDEVQVSVRLPDRLDAPVAADIPIGWVSYMLNGEAVRKYPLYADHGVARRDLAYCFSQIRRCFFLEVFP